MKHSQDCSTFLPIIRHQKSKIGFYFHIPFCPHICPYCDFTKTSRFSTKDVHAYFNALYISLDAMLNEFSDNPYMQQLTDCTVYFGGGTPSLFDAKFYAPIITKLSQKFALEEVTIETNPFSNRESFVAGYKQIGINRVTLGAQSLCHDTLKMLGRKHTKENIIHNIQWLKESGIEQIQVDLIYGLSHKRTISIDEEIKTIISAGATGISAYGLTLESRTVFGKSSDCIIDEDKAIQEYESILSTCAQLGLRQIETSNFSFFEAKHNNLYWYGYPYFGLGTGAHGLLPPTPTALYGTRYKVGVAVGEYAPGDDLLKYSQPHDLQQHFQLICEPVRTWNDMIQELIFTLLRTEHGIPRDWLVNIFQDDQIVESKILIHPQIKRGWEEKKIIITPTHIALTPLEKIRGDAWALIFLNAVPQIIQLFKVIRH